MPETPDHSLIFRVGGAVILLLAGFLFLLRETNGLTFHQRCRKMLSIIIDRMIWLLPSRSGVKITLAGLGGFVAGTLICGSIFAGLIYWYMSTFTPVSDLNVVLDRMVVVLGIAAFGLIFSLVCGMMTGMYYADRVMTSITKAAV